MKKTINKILTFFKLRPAATNRVIKDLLLNDHHYCKVCGDLFYSTSLKQIYCSRGCKQKFNNAKRFTP